jgi:hypothetical protein
MVMGLDEHGVEFAVLDPQSDRELIARLRSHSDWAIDYQDGEVVILIHLAQLDRERNETRIHSVL